MNVINKTNLDLDLEDLLKREWWTVELRGLEIPVKPLSLDGWAVIVSWKNGKHPFIGHFHPSKKLIEIKLNPANRYPLTWEAATGTERLTPALYRYKLEKITFNDPSELIRFIFCHEFSHVLDHLQGFSLMVKQTKANRFALRHYLKLQGHAPSPGGSGPRELGEGSDG